MVKPIILVVDDDTEVLRAIERDVRRQYGGQFRILSAHSGEQALDLLQQLRARNEAVAFILTDQRMPAWSGTELLERAIALAPQAKRVLLTAYADTDAAIRAINRAKIDYYLTKPWDPPEEHLYPVMQDLLDDWLATFRPPFDGIRVVGHRWSPQSHEVKNFLTQNLIPYQWLDLETQPEAQHALDASGGNVSHLPLVVFPDGSVLTMPTTAQLAQKMGMQTQAERPFYDLIIVGSGPAGLAAAVYGASEGLRTVLIEREAPGGQAGTSSRIENYLGFPVGLSGADLARRAVTQARRFGAEILSPQEVIGIRAEGPYRFVQLANGTELSCHALLITTGVSYRRLDVPGVDHLTGAGIYYGAARAEALSCRDEDVFIVGGANSAGQAAISFALQARSVTMLIRGDSLAKGMSQYLVDQIEATENIAVQLCTSVVKVQGATNLETITLANARTGEIRTVSATALFIFIGAMPCTEWTTELLARDAQGFLLTGPDLIHAGHHPKGWALDRAPFLLETNVPGIFVAGDVRHGSVKRVASGVGEGSIAIQFIHRYLGEVR